MGSVSKAQEVELRMGAGVACEACKGSGVDGLFSARLHKAGALCKSCNGIGRRPVPRNAKTHSNSSHRFAGKTIVTTWCGHWPPSVLMAPAHTTPTCGVCRRYGAAVR